MLCMVERGNWLSSSVPRSSLGLGLVDLAHTVGTGSAVEVRSLEKVKPTLDFSP